MYFRAATVNCISVSVRPACMHNVAISKEKNLVSISVVHYLVFDLVQMFLSWNLGEMREIGIAHYAITRTFPTLRKNVDHR